MQFHIVTLLNLENTAIKQLSVVGYSSNSYLLKSHATTVIHVQVPVAGNFCWVIDDPTADKAASES